MNPAAVAQRLGDRLEEDGLDYAIGGALALGAWGAPRLTMDVDMSIFAPVAQFARISDALDRAGVMFDRDRAPKDIERIGMFTGRLGAVVVDIFVSNHPHMHEMHARRQRIDAADGTHLYFISPEDLCVMKLVYGRAKDVGDLERLFGTRKLDVAYIRAWVAKMPVGPSSAAVLDDLVRRFG